jgi:hypothetical protein
MAPAIIAAIISAAASKMKSNQESASRMNEGNKTGGPYQISSENVPVQSSYQPSSQGTSTIGSGLSDLGKNLVSQYLKKIASDAPAGVRAERITSLCGLPQSITVPSGTASLAPTAQTSLAQKIIRFFRQGAVQSLLSAVYHIASANFH